MVRKMPITLTNLERYWLALTASWFAFVFGAIGEEFQDYDATTSDGFIIWCVFFFAFHLHQLSQDLAVKRKIESIIDFKEEEEFDEDDIAVLSGVMDHPEKSRRNNRIIIAAFISGLALFLLPFTFRILTLDSMMRYYSIWFFIFAAGLVVILLLRARAWMRAA